jgi:hypothetical protein
MKGESMPSRKVSEEKVNLPARRAEPGLLLEREMTATEVLNQNKRIRDIVKMVMKPKVHYGSVPGIPKPFLQKPGAEVLAMTFRLIPRYTTKERVIEGGHVIYTVKCVLYHISGTRVGEGVGAGSTQEKKYRYRTEFISTGVDVPPAWWDKKKMENLPKIVNNQGGKLLSPEAVKKDKLTLSYGKDNGKWKIGYIKKIENPDIADQINTVLKVAKKRALVDAVITVFGLSDMFTQDKDAVMKEEEEDDAK